MTTDYTNLAAAVLAESQTLLDHLEYGIRMDLEEETILRQALRSTVSTFTAATDADFDLEKALQILLELGTDGDIFAREFSRPSADELILAWREHKLI